MLGSCVTIKLSIITKVVHACYVDSLSILWINEISGEGMKQFYLQTEDAYISTLATFTSRCCVVALDSVHIQGGYINLCRNTGDWQEESEEEDERSHGLLLNSCDVDEESKSLVRIQVEILLFI